MRLEGLQKSIRKVLVMQRNINFTVVRCLLENKEEINIKFLPFYGFVYSKSPFMIPNQYSICPFIEFKKSCFDVM